MNRSFRRWAVFFGLLATALVGRWTMAQLRSLGAGVEPAVFVPDGTTFERRELGQFPPAYGVDVVASSDGKTLHLEAGEPGRVQVSHDGGGSFVGQERASVGAYGSTIVTERGPLRVGATLSSLHPLQHSQVWLLPTGEGERRLLLEGTRVDAGVPEQLRNLVLASGPQGSLHLALLHALRGTVELGYLGAKDGHSWQSRGLIPGARSVIHSQPALAVGEQAVHLAYEDAVSHRLQVLRSEDEGATWARCAEVPLGGRRGFEPLRQAHPQLFVTRTGLVLLYVDQWKRMNDLLMVETRAEVLFARSTDGCRTWSESRSLNDLELRFERALKSAGPLPEPELSQLRAHVSPSGQFAVALWKDRREGLGAVHFTSTRDGGKSWTVNRRLVPEVEGQVLHFDAWVADSGALNLFYKDEKGRLRQLSTPR